MVLHYTPYFSPSPTTDLKKKKKGGGGIPQLRSATILSRQRIQQKIPVTSTNITVTSMLFRKPLTMSFPRTLQKARPLSRNTARTTNISARAHGNQVALMEGGKKNQHKKNDARVVKKKNSNTLTETKTCLDFSIGSWTRKI